MIQTLLITRIKILNDWVTKKLNYLFAISVFMRSVRLTQRPIFQMVVRIVSIYKMKTHFLGDFQSVFHMPRYITFSALVTNFEQWRRKFNLARGSLRKCSRAQICLLWFDPWLLGIEIFCTIDSCWINSVYNLSTYKWSSLMPGTASRSLRFHFSCDVKGDLGKESKLGMCTQRMDEVSFWQEVQLSSSTSLFFPCVMLEENCSKVKNSAFFSWISDVQDLYGCKTQQEHITSLLIIVRY